MTSRKNVPRLAELAAICGGEGTRPGEPRDLRRLYARLIRRLSIRITRPLLMIGLSANQVTVAGIGIGITGAAMLAFNDVAVLTAGLVLLQLSFVLDFCDGEIARYEREVEGVTNGAGGAYLDWIGHYYVPAVITVAVAWGAYKLNGSEAVLIAAFITTLSLVRVPYSARDHIMWGVYRDNPDKRSSESMVRAALARQGGNPALLDLEAPPAERMQGGRGSGLLWSRYTNFGQLIVFPGFINLVAVAIVVDMVMSRNYPAVGEEVARTALTIGLGAVHLLHQLRATVQGYRVTRAL